MSTNDNDRRPDEPAAQDARETTDDPRTSTCPACDSEVEDEKLLDDEQCPACETPTSTLFEVAAELTDPEDLDLDHDDESDDGPITEGIVYPDGGTEWQAAASAAQRVEDVEERGAE